MGFWDFFWSSKKKSTEAKQERVTEEIKKSKEKKEESQSGIVEGTIQGESTSKQVESDHSSVATPSKKEEPTQKEEAPATHLKEGSPSTDQTKKKAGSQKVAKEDGAVLENQEGPSAATLDQEEDATAEESPEEMPGSEVVKKEKKAIQKKSTSSFWSKLKRIFVGPRKLTEEELENIEEILIEADLGVKMTEEIMDRLQGQVNEDFSFEAIVEVVKKEISSRLNAVHSSEVEATGLPHVILVVGVNGVGKTTTIGKLAHYYVSQGKKVVLGAADTFRAAAPEQLTTWAKRSSSAIVNRGMQKDPSGVAYETIQEAQKEKADVVIIDTAGRLQNKLPLMNQLGKIKRVIQKLMPAAPHEVLLVLDATTGQNGWQQATAFQEAVGVTGLIVTKLDSMAKGGIIIGITSELGIPVKYVGFGEKIGDLGRFDVEEFVERFFQKTNHSR